MFAVVIDPAVCHTWAGWLIAECYGILLFKGAVLTVAMASSVVAAYAVRRAAPVRS
jgi:hypothetical protein